MAVLVHLREQLHGGPRTFVTPLFIEKKLLIHNKKITFHSPPPNASKILVYCNLTREPLSFSDRPFNSHNLIVDTFLFSATYFPVN